jgi:biuret amidohydrolase
VIARAAQLFAALRARRMPIVHVVTEYRDAEEILANPFWRAIHDDPTKARKRMSGHNIIGEPTTEIIPDLIEPGDWMVRGKKRYSPFRSTDLAFLLERWLQVDTLRAGGTPTTEGVGQLQHFP